MNSALLNSCDIPLIPSGKYAGQPATVLFDDIGQMEWLKSQPWFDKNPKWKPVYNLIVHQSLVQPGADSKTPEHNKLQNMFFDPNVQKRLIKRIFSTHLVKMKDSINNLIKDPEFIDCFGIKPEHTIDDLLRTLKVKVVAEGEFNWDIILTYGNGDISFDSIEEIEKQFKKTYEKMNNLENYEEEQLMLYEAAKKEYEQKLFELDNDSTSETNRIDIRQLFGGPNNLYKKQTLTSGFNEYEKRYKTNILTYKQTYIAYKKKYYNDLVSRYFKSTYYEITKRGDIYAIDIIIFSNEYSVFCELKPSLSDDYPCVLRKMRSQIELRKSKLIAEDNRLRKLAEKYDDDYRDVAETIIRRDPHILILGKFSSKYTDIELLKKKFDNIRIIFTDELLDAAKPAPVTENTENTGCSNCSTLYKEISPDIAILLHEISSLKSELAKSQEETRELKEQLSKLQKQNTSSKPTKIVEKSAKSITEYFKK